MQIGPRPHAHGSVTGVLADVLSGGFGPARGVRALHLGPVATGASDVFRRVAQARVAVEASSRSQTDEDLARTSLEPLLHLDRVVARVEDEQGSSGRPFLARRPA